jgi:hypothetical protein
MGCFMAQRWRGSRRGFDCDDSPQALAAIEKEWAVALNVDGEQVFAMRKTIL